MSDFFINLWAIIQLLLGFTFLIFVHELGHFLMAKKVGVRATQFAIGFGQALVAYRKGIGFRIGTTEPEFREKVLERAQAEGRELPETLDESDIHQLADEFGYGETEYRFNWIPFGGYVKMVGQEDLDPNAASKDPRSFTQASFWGRMGIISAGVIMNAVFAVGFFIIAFSIGVDFPPAIAGYPVPGGPAATAVAKEDPDIVGIQTGDHVVAIDGEPTTDFTEIMIAAPLGDENEPIEFVVERPNLDGSPARRLTFSITPEPANPKKGVPLPRVGIEMPRKLQLLTEAELADAGRKLLGGHGLEPAMHITAVNGTATEHYWQLERLVDASDGKPVKMTFTDKDSGKTVDTTFNVVPNLPSAAFKTASGKSAGEVRHLLGLVPPVEITFIADKAAAKDQLRKGDVFVAVAGVRWPTRDQIIDAVEKSGGEAVELTVRREGTDHDFTIKPNDTKAGYKLGVGLYPAVRSNVVAHVLPDSPFDGTGLVSGTTLERVGDRDIATYHDLYTAFAASTGDAITMTVDLPGGATPEATERYARPADLDAHLAAVRWNLDDPPLLRQLRITQKADGIVEAATMGFEKTHLIMIQTYLTLIKTIRGWIPVENLHGPVGIVAQGKNVTKRGFAYLMFFLGLISINLAVINFLPMPIVDGGLAVLLIIEKLRGKPLPANVAGTINLVGLLLIATLFITLTYHDIARIFEG